MADKKFVVILNKRFELAQMASAIGHVTAGLASSQPQDDLSFVTYRDADGVEYPWISDWSFVILRGGAGQLRTLKESLDRMGLPAVCYTETMFSGGSEAQQASTNEKKTSDVEIVALATFGDVDAVNAHTKKFSVWPR